MSGWIEFLKLVGAFGSGAGLILMREAIAARLDRNRKREALWRACALEAPGAWGDFENTYVLRDKVLRGRPVGGVFHAPTTAAKLAEKLLESDPENLDAYLSYIIRTEQHEQRTADIKELLADYADADDDERRKKTPRLLSELFFCARAIGWLYADRLRVLRVLKSSMKNEAFANKLIVDVEETNRAMQANIDDWEAQHTAVLRGKHDAPDNGDV
jgi:hypothetical protein